MFFKKNMVSYFRTFAREFVKYDLKSQKFILKELRTLLNKEVVKNGKRKNYKIFKRKL